MTSGKVAVGDEGNLHVSCLVSRVSCLVSRVSCLVSRVSCLVSRSPCVVTPRASLHTSSFTPLGRGHRTSLCVSRETARFKIPRISRIPAAPQSLNVIFCHEKRTVEGYRSRDSFVRCLPASQLGNEWDEQRTRQWSLLRMEAREGSRCHHSR